MRTILNALVLWICVSQVRCIIRLDRAKVYVRAFDHHQLTSSTLAWVSQRDVKNTKHEVVHVGAGTLPWCRLRYRVWVSGAVNESVCEAPFLQELRSSTDGQVLVSLNGLSRWKTFEWDGLALNGRIVSTDDVLLAYREHPFYGYMAGYVDPKSRTAYVRKDKGVAKEDSANLVIEIEPIFYRLHNVLYTAKPNFELEDEFIEKVKLENHKDEAAEVEKDVTFRSLHKTYFGSVDGTITGKEASVPSPHGGTMNITWGCTPWSRGSKCNDKSINRSYKIRRLLPPRSYVNVHLIASIRTLEVPYKAEIEAVFEDGETIVRNITSFHKEERLAELKGNFSRPYHIDYDYPIDDTVAMMQIFLHSSTTSAPTTVSDSSTQGASQAYISYLLSTICLLVCCCKAYL